MKENQNQLQLEDDQIAEIIRQYKLIDTESLRKREHGGAGYSERDDFQRDYARILYSPSFRRLQGKMQIMGIKSDAFFRNRLTHSLEVAQIATSIAFLLSKACKCILDEEIYKDDIYVLEAAALAHDIGHPAFGHKGERVLDEIAKTIDKRFEGNAQNFRVLRNLEVKDNEWKGLNLTYRTLLAINKYIVKEDKEVKKFMYEDDYKFLDDIRRENNLQGVRTLDVQIIEIADDIAYAVHDLEDGLALRKFNVDEILYLLKAEENKEKGEEKKETPSKQFEDIVSKAKEYAEKNNNTNIQEYSKIFRTKLTSLLVNTFVHDITLEKVSDAEAKKRGIKKGKEELSLKIYKNLLKALKSNIFTCATRDTGIQEYEIKGELIIKTLFNIYSNPKSNPNAMLLPPDYRPNKDEPNFEKMLKENSINYIAGMMDTFAISKFEDYTGIAIDKVNLDSIENKDTNENIFLKIIKKSLKLC
ncbi:deoxyguanosinetriphosphate triphosphohydrolase family protein [Prevotella intermedia]|uniref:deoxyguanosinetriphosphate triphosphohydrolase family protein n=1 Tax=Prevotella intermedia TaxID=28131 RepID=UPI000BE73D84|nr:dNTP triphosphohydrolase [Prevotella intermedia]PDP68973.1 deoxyguanosinetriphosphate triphosphohydrolase [Prevotella intermedia]